MANYPAPYNLSDNSLKENLKMLIEYRVKVKLELSIITYEKKEVKDLDDKEMELLNSVISEYIEELVYKRRLSI